MNKQEIGSITAKGGFLNESDICVKFLNYKTDVDAQKWLVVMGYDFKKINSISALQIPVRINRKKSFEFGVSDERYEETIKFKKADIQIKIQIVIEDIVYVENLSLKKSNKSAGFNQVDKRPVSTYQKMWNFNPTIEKWLKVFTGEILPKDVKNKIEVSKNRDQRRLFLDEIPQKYVEEIIDFFKINKSLVIADILKGRGGLSAEWLLVTRKNSDGTIDWILIDINTACNFYAQGEVVLSPRGSLKIGRITMQRKGGTPDPTSLQFKLNPLELFNA